MTLPWYPRDMGKYARDTGHLSLIEHGAYNLLLDHYYSTGGLPQVSNAGGNAQLLPDHSRLYRVCKAIGKAEQDAVDAVLKFFFKLSKDGFYVHDKCEETLAEQEQKHQRRVDAGRKGGQSNASSNAASNAPQTQTKTKKETPRAFKNDFEEKNGGNFAIERHLTDNDRAKAKQAAPGWDLYVLMRDYDERVNGGSFERPRKPAAAFIAWCASFTKGKPP